MIRGAFKSLRGQGLEAQEELRYFSRLAREFLQPLLSQRRLSSQAPSILIQAHRSPKYHVTAALLGSALAVERDARLIVYRFASCSSERGLRARVRASLRRLQRWLIEPAASRREDTAWASHIADDVVELRAARSDLRRADAIIRSYCAVAPTVETLVELEVDGVNVGEAVIDKIVQKGFVRPDPLAAELLVMLHKEVVQLLALERFIRSHPATAMVAIDIANAPGISLRFALSRGIDAFIAQHRQFVRLTHRQPFTGMASQDFPELLEGLGDSLRAAVRREGAMLLESRLAPGSTGFSTTGSAVWSGGRSEFLESVDRKGRRVILVAAHSFYDAQHAGGPFLFTDFFSWLEHIRSIADRTSHLWLVKLHPDHRDKVIGVRAAVEGLFNGREDVILLPDGVTQRQLLDFGIDLVYTIYGTVAMEFPYLGIPSLTARPRSTHAPFGYALVPKSRDDLERILLDEREWEYPVDRNEICEYAALQYLAVRPALSCFLAGQGPLADAESLWDGDWSARISRDSFRAGMRCLHDWLASGTHSAAHFLGARDFLEGLRVRLPDPD